MRERIKKRLGIICPDAKGSRFSEVPLCRLNDKYCLIETGYECDYYEDYASVYRRDDCPLAGGIECCGDCQECEK